MKIDPQKALICLQEAVDLELERKAKLGYKAVVLAKNGSIKIVSAQTLVRQRNKQKARAAALQ